MRLVSETVRREGRNYYADNQSPVSLGNSVRLSANSREASDGLESETVSASALYCSPHGSPHTAQNRPRRSRVQTLDPQAQLISKSEAIYANEITTKILNTTINKITLLILTESF